MTGGGVEENRAAEDAAFESAAHDTTLELVNNRLIANPMEPRVGAPDVGSWAGRKSITMPRRRSAPLPRALNRPVKSTSSRSEAFMSHALGRDHVTRIELALDAETNFAALRTDTHANIGAYLSTFAPSLPTWLHGTLMAGNYRTHLIY